jgi:hypothetical protein
VRDELVVRRLNHNWRYRMRRVERAWTLVCVTGTFGIAVAQLISTGHVW